MLTLPKYLAATAFTGGFLLASCAAPNDLSAISQYASVTAQSADSFSAVAADYAKSCERWETIDRGIIATSSSPQSSALVTRTPAPSNFTISSTPAPGYPPPSTKEYEDATMAGAPSAPSGNLTPPSDCAEAQSVSTSWNNANGIVLDYVKALGNLAGADTVPTPNPSPFVSGLSAVGVSSAATGAISTLITSIGTYIENKARDQAITDFLRAVNSTFPIGIGALERVDVDYTNRLKSEYNATKAKYNEYARLELNDVGKFCRAVAGEHAKNARGNIEAACRQTSAERLLQKESVVVASLSAVNQNLRAAADYGSAVQTVLATHDQLYAASQRNASFSDYLNVVQNTAEPAVTALVDLAKAVK